MTPESPQGHNNNNSNNETGSNSHHSRDEHQDHYHDLQEDEDEDDLKHDSRVLFVFNLTVDTREEDIMKEFAPYGKVESVKIVMDRKKLINRGFCFVTMASVEEATRLREVKIIVKGQPLHIEKAARTEGHNSTPGQGYQGKRTPRERLMPKSLRDKDHPRSRGGRDSRSGGSSSGGRGGGKGGPPFRQRGGHTPKGGRLPPGSYLPPQSGGQPTYDYFNYGYYGYPYGQFPPPGTPPLSEEHARSGATGSSTSSTSGSKEARPFSNPPYSGYPPGTYPYSGYPPGAYGYPPGAYGYYPPYGPNGNYDYPPYAPPGTREPSSPGSSRPSNRISPSRTHPHHGGPRYYSSGTGSNYRYNPYPSVSEGASNSGVPSGPVSLHQPPSPGAGADYESPPTNYGVYGESQPWINK